MLVAGLLSHHTAPPVIEATSSLLPLHNFSFEQIYHQQEGSRENLLRPYHPPYKLVYPYVQAEVSPPAVVRAADLVAAVWPPGSTLRRPQLRFEVLMGPAGAALDFSLHPSGTAYWCGDYKELCLFYNLDSGASIFGVQSICMALWTGFKF